jgi:hypothetical protein
MGGKPFPFMKLPEAAMTAVARKLPPPTAWKFAIIVEQASPAAAAAVLADIQSYELLERKDVPVKNKGLSDAPKFLQRLGGLQQLTLALKMHCSEEPRTGEMFFNGYRGSIGRHNKGVGVHVSFF